MSPSERYAALLAYLRAKLEERDWHGVRDAAADLEFMEAKYPELKEAK